CRGLPRSWSMSLSLDLHPLRLGRGTRSGAAPSCFRKKLGGAIALCASRGESHKHVWALRHLGQELGHMNVVLVRTCVPCWTTFSHVSDGLISVEAVWAPPLPPVWSLANSVKSIAWYLCSSAAVLVVQAACPAAK